MLLVVRQLVEQAEEDAEQQLVGDLAGRGDQLVDAAGLGDPPGHRRAAAPRSRGARGFGRWGRPRLAAAAAGAKEAREEQGEGAGAQELKLSEHRSGCPWYPTGTGKGKPAPRC